MSDHTIDKPYGRPGSLSNLPKTKFWTSFESLCKEHGHSIRSAASAIGVGNATTTRWRKGVIPDVATLNKISKYFNVTIDELLGNDEDFSKMTLLEDEIKLVKTYRKMNETDKQIISVLIGKYED